MRSRFLAVLVAVAAFGVARQVDAGFVWNVQAPGSMERIEIHIDNFEYTIDHDGSQLLNQAIPYPPTAPYPSPLSPIVSVADSLNDEIRGIFKVVSIQKEGDPSTVFWADAAGPEELTGTFSGFFASGFAGGPPAIVVDFALGGMKIYYDDAAGVTPMDSSFAAVPGIDPLLVGHGDFFADGGDLFLDVVGVGGIAPFNLATTLTSTILGGTNPPTGFGSGYLDIIGGSGAHFFVPDAMDPAGPGGTAGFQDLKLINTVTAEPTSTVNGGADGTMWPLTSGDPIDGQIIPEPSTVVVWSLLAACVAGLSWLRRRRGM